MHTHIYIYMIYIYIYMYKIIIILHITVVARFCGMHVASLDCVDCLCRFTYIRVYVSSCIFMSTVCVGRVQFSSLRSPAQWSHWDRAPPINRTRGLCHWRHQVATNWTHCKDVSQAAGIICLQGRILDLMTNYASYHDCSVSGYVQRCIYYFSQAKYYHEQSSKSCIIWLCIVWTDKNIQIWSFSDSLRFTMCQTRWDVAMLWQASGEAEYIPDMPARPHQLYAAFVVAAKGNCMLRTTDPVEALVCG